MQLIEKDTDLQLQCLMEVLQSGNASCLHLREMQRMHSC